MGKMMSQAVVVAVAAGMGGGVDVRSDAGGAM